MAFRNSWRVAETTIPTRRLKRKPVIHKKADDNLSNGSENKNSTNDVDNKASSTTTATRATESATMQAANCQDGIGDYINQGSPILNAVLTEISQESSDANTLDSSAMDDQENFIFDFGPSENSISKKNTTSMQRTTETKARDRSKARANESCSKTEFSSSPARTHESGTHTHTADSKTTTRSTSPISCPENAYIDFLHPSQTPPAADIEGCILKIDVDIINWFLFLLGFLTRFYRLSYPRDVVFDELHYGKSVAHYVRNIFFFDQHPPLGKQIIAAVIDTIGYDGNFTATRIGSPYADNFPVFWMRFIPALCGSLLPTAVYTLLKTSGVSRWYSLLGGLLLIFDNSLLTQSRFVLMESMLLLFSMLGLCFLLKFQKSKFPQFKWILYAVGSALMLSFSFCVKYAGFYTYLLAIYLVLKYIWDEMGNPYETDSYITLESIAQLVIFITIPLMVYVGVFYVHLQTLYKAGPHDAMLTSAFQASLEGGLAAITRNQPLRIAHGSQITLRHTHGRRCWLHSHAHVYPVRYADKRGSSHQQQVTCYPFKDVNNWWIVKKPDLEDVVVGDEPEYIQHGDIIQLVHGITSRALNSHDVAAPLTPQCQEVSCYIDYEINMKSELLWRVDILNRDTEGAFWKTIKSEVNLIHVSTGAALKFSGRILPEWGFNQHEIVADRAIDSKDVIWNVEEHRYTKDGDQEERERKLLMAQMIPTEAIKLSFFEKFLELQGKMLLTTAKIDSHMYSSQPWEWPLVAVGIGYWLDSSSNKQIYLLGNVLIWYSATISLIVYFILFCFYLLRRRRLVYDIDELEWKRFLNAGHLYFVGYVMHYAPYFIKDEVLFLHQYLPAFIFKAQLLCFIIDHLDYLLRRFYGSSPWVIRSYRMAVFTWLVAVVSVFVEFLPLTYGFKNLTVEDMIKLRWKDSWEFITHRIAKRMWALKL